MTRSCVSIVAVACAVLLAGACESSKKSTTMPATAPSMGMLNTTCPLSGEPVDPNADSVTYMDHTIGFCCNGCVGGWNKMSDAEKTSYVHKAMK